MNEDIMNIMNYIQYGYMDIKGEIHKDVDDKFSTLYRLQSPQETLKNKIGVCWDQVELERYLFEERKIKFKTFFIVHYDNDKCPTHTFLIYNDNNKYYWFEHSWKKHRGIYVYDNELEALKDIKDKFIKDELINKYNYRNLCIYEYSKPNYGINVLDFYCENGNNITIE